MKKSLKNWVGARLSAQGTKHDQWEVNDDLVFSGDSLEPRVLLNALAFDDIAVVSEDAAFDSTVDGLNPITSGNTDTSVVDNDFDLPFPSPAVEATSSSVAGLYSVLGLDPVDEALDFNADGTFAFDGTASEVIQSLSANEVGAYNFEYVYANEDPDVGNITGATVTLGVIGANDPFELTFGGPNYEYVANGNKIQFDAPLVQISDVDDNDAYRVELVVAPANPNHPGPLGMLFLDSEGEHTANGTLVIEGTLDEVNAALQEVCYKPANLEYDADLDPYKLKQHIDISVTEIAGGAVNPGDQLEDVEPEETTVTSIAVLEAKVDAAGAVVFNHYPIANDDNISFNEDGLVDYRVGNLLDNDVDPEGDAIKLKGLWFDGTPATPEVNVLGGVQYDFRSDGDYGVLYFNEDGSFRYEFNDDVDFLAFGEQIKDEFTYKIIDSAWNKSKDPATLKVTINGTKDAPEFKPVKNHDTDPIEAWDGPSAWGSTWSDDDNNLWYRPTDGDAAPVAAALKLKEQATPAPIEVDFDAFFSDLDASDLHTVEIKGVYLGGDVPPGKTPGQFKTDGTYYDMLSAGEIDNTNPEHRVLGLSFDANASALNYLDKGDELYLIYKICVTDPKDCTAEAYVKIKINGTEDKPLLWVENNGTVVEGDKGDDMIMTSGVLGIDGVDEDDQSTFLPNNNRPELIGTYGRLVIQVDENGLESWKYILDNESPAVQMLDAGDVAEDNFYLLIYDNGQIQYELDEWGEPVVDDNGKRIPCKVHVCIDIIGTDDEPKLTMDPAWVAEGNVGHETFVEGVVTIVDVDADDNPTFATNPLQPGSGTGIGTYGEITGVVQIPNPDHDPEDKHSPEYLEVYTYVPNQELIQFLAKGEELVDSVELTAYDYTLKDEYGNTIVREMAKKTVMIVIKGTNDAPEVTSDKVTVMEEPGVDSMFVSVTAEGTLEASDVDLSDEVFVEAKPEVSTSLKQQVVDKDGEITYEEVPFWRDITGYDSVNTDNEGVPEALLEMLTLPEGPVVASGEETGTIEWTFDSGLEGFDFLAKGEKLTIVYNVCVIDSCGETADATITIHILGKNDRPDIFVGEHDSAMEMMKENFSGGFGGPVVVEFNSGGHEIDGRGYYKSGTLSVSDKDVSDAVTAFEGFGHGVIGVQVQSTNPIPPDTGLTEGEFLSMMTLLDATTVVGVGETEGVLQWVFETGRNFDFLAEGEELTLTYTIEVSDKHATDTQDVVIKIKGTNDRPELKFGKFADTDDNVPEFFRFGYSGSQADAIDANDFYNNGTLVSDLLQAQQEDKDVFGSKQGIAVQGFAFSKTTTGAEDWEYSLDDGETWTSFADDTSPENATVLAPDARVRFVPDNLGDNSGWAKLKFVLWDQTDDNASGTGGVDSTERFVYDEHGEPCGESAYGRQMLWFTVEVAAPAQDDPVADDDIYEAPADSVSLLGSVLTNDEDPDTANSDLTASLLNPVPGVTMFADGTFSFDSTGLLPGQSTSFQYVVSDGVGSDIGTVTINIAEAEASIAGPPEFVLGKGGSYTATPGGGFGPIVGDAWYVDGVQTASGSTFDFNPPTAGTFVLTYMAMDSGGGIATASTVVEVVPAAIVAGDLVIGGTDGADNIVVNAVGSNYQVNFNGWIGSFAQADVTGDIIICGFGGDDDIRVAPGITASTQIFGGAGNDLIYGGGGSDYIEAGSGNDTVFGRNGSDTIFGQGGDDELYGNKQRDFIFTGVGTDSAFGGDGDDVLRGDGGVDTMEGNAGNDELFGGTEDDNLSGGTGDDMVKGQEGNDIVDGDGGNDMLSGGEGDDTVNGGMGDDMISGMGGNDTLIGMGGDDVITGGDGNDIISAGNGDDIAEGGLGDDEIRGNAGDDAIYGGAGEDDLSGGNDDDEIFGGEDDDFIIGNAGNDTMDGQGGDDTILGVQGDDTLTGGAGVDVLNGGAGFDTSIDVGETEILIEL